MTEKMKVVLDINEHEIECTCEFDYTPFTPGRLSGPPENCYPDESEEYDPTKLSYVLFGVEYDISCLLPLVEDDLESSFNIWKKKMLSEAEALEEQAADDAYDRSRDDEAEKLGELYYKRKGEF